MSHRASRSWSVSVWRPSWSGLLAVSIVLAACSSKKSAIGAVATGTGGAGAVPAAVAGAGGAHTGGSGHESAGGAGGNAGASGARASGAGTGGAGTGGAGATAAGGAGAAGADAGAAGADEDAGGGSGDVTDGSGGEQAGTGGAGGSEPGAGGTAGSAGDSAAQPVNAWTMMGYDANNWYFNPAEKTLSVSNATQLVEKWRFTVEGMPAGSPAIAEGKVFALAYEGLYAIDLATGRQVWSRTDISGTSSVAYDNGSIYVMNLRPPHLYKLKAEDGSTIWGPSAAYDAELSDGESSPIIAAGKVIVGHSNAPRELSLNIEETEGARGGVETFDAATGEKLWTYYTVPDVTEGTENGASVWSSVAIDVANATVYATTGNNFTVAGPNSDAFHAFDLLTGNRIWVTQVLKNDLFCLLCGGDLLTADMDFGANPILVEIEGRQVVAAGNKNSDFYAVDRKTGEIIWSRDKLSPSGGALFGGIFISGAFDGRHFYTVANNGSNETAIVYKLDPKTGADVWKRDLDDVNWGAISLANGLLFVPKNAELLVLNSETGEVLTSFQTGGTIAGGAAAVAEGRVVVKSGLEYLGNVVNNNQIICYGLP